MDRPKNQVLWCMCLGIVRSIIKEPEEDLTEILEGDNGTDMETNEKKEAAPILACLPC